MAGKVKSICEENLTQIIEDLGYELVEIEYIKKADGMNLTFYIDNTDGIKIEDCEKVSRTIDPILEELNPTDDVPYILNVSSPGLDRPIKTDRDLQRNIQKEILITLFSKIDGNKKFQGNLEKFDDEFVYIRDKKEKEYKIERKQIAHIVPIIKF